MSVQSGVSAHRRALRGVAFLAAMTTVATVGSGIAATAASAAAETTPPVLTALATLPASVDVTTDPGAIAVVMHVTDDLSGFASATVSATCTTACGSATTLSGSTQTFAAGPATDQQVDIALTVPQSVPNGSHWTVDSVVLND